jgi:hypothetical protein
MEIADWKLITAPQEGQLVVFIFYIIIIIKFTKYNNNKLNKNPGNSPQLTPRLKQR